MTGRRIAPLFLDPDELNRLPATVWIPVRMPRFGGSVPQLALHELAQGGLTLPVYSSVDLLREYHGAYGQAIEYPSGDLEQLRQMVGFATVALDIRIPSELRLSNGGSEDDGGLVATPQTDPGVVWVPCRPMRDGDRHVQVELHTGEDDEVVLAAFTSRERLAAGCGEHQPAASFRVEDLAEIAAQTGADVIAYDPTLRAAARHHDPSSSPEKRR